MRLSRSLRDVYSSPMWFSPFPPFCSVCVCAIYHQVPDETAAPPAEGEKPKMKTVTKKSNVWEKVNVSKVTTHDQTSPPAPFLTRPL